MFRTVVLLLLAAVIYAQGNDQAAREQIRSAVRSHLNLKVDQFLAVREGEKLEQSLAMLGRPGVLIYHVSRTGDEIKGNTLVHHISMDADLTYVVAIIPSNDRIYRVHGFNDSVAEFDKFVTGLTIANSEQAEIMAALYREINPGNYLLAPVSNLLDLKQTAERQCHSDSFEAAERKFDSWWARFKLPYSQVPFQQTVVAEKTGYLIEWTGLSSPSGECAGAPLRASLHIGSDGHVSPIKFSPARRIDGR